MILSNFWFETWGILVCETGILSSANVDLALADSVLI